MKRLYVGALVAGLGLSPAAVAQTDAVILGTDQFGTSLRVAPGDIVTFNATGLTSSLSGTVGSVRATGTPLPATLAGISATMAQTRASSLAEKGPVPVPLLRVGKHKDYNSRCSIPEGLLVQPWPEVTNVTVQIPYAMAPDIPFTFNFPNTVQIVITDGTHNAATLVYP